MSRSNPKSAPPSDYRVGDRVELRFGSSFVSGIIVEDRGNIGVGGRRLLRVRVSLDPSFETFVEVPVQELRAA